MIKKFAIALLGFFVVAAALAGVKTGQIRRLMAMDHSQPPAAVSTAPVVAETWSPQVRGIGTVVAVQGVTLAAEADGALIKIHYENGAQVKAGDALFELDTTVEAAQLRATEAQLELAKLNARRAAELSEKGTISTAERDQAVATLNQAEANAAAIRATIEKKTVRAPFSGRLGIRHVNLGQFVSRGTPMIQIQDLSSVYVNFSIPQRQVAEITPGLEVGVKIDAYAGRVFRAKVLAIEPAVDAATRNLAVQAIVSNNEELLRPGMFAHVDVQLAEKQEVLVVPATAIAYAAYGNSVYIVEQMKNAQGQEYLGVRQQFVKLGDRRGDQIAIISGVKPGEQVVSAGVFKLRNSLPVQINNTVQPSNNPDPKPANS
ncbi:efflux RND transporter periplasmic adaptor subunit [Nibricoccus sp. IMCC34717]|uniref:efflux RND transporter periplasmic adaptor subunit n=1 Tax=Nibricoccus sp. IMCC34717 TaxID=3034021 RepID=UPI003850B58B